MSNQINTKVTKPRYENLSPAQRRAHWNRLLAAMRIKQARGETMTPTEYHDAIGFYTELVEEGPPHDRRTVVKVYMPVDVLAAEALQELNFENNRNINPSNKVRILMLMTQRDKNSEFYFSEQPEDNIYLVNEKGKMLAGAHRTSVQAEHNIEKWGTIIFGATHKNARASNGAKQDTIEDIRIQNSETKMTKGQRALISREDAVFRAIEVAANEKPRTGGRFNEPVVDMYVEFYQEEVNTVINMTKPRNATKLSAWGIAAFTLMLKSDEANKFKTKELVKKVIEGNELTTGSSGWNMREIITDNTNCGEFSHTGNRFMMKTLYLIYFYHKYRCSEFNKKTKLTHTPSLKDLSHFAQPLSWLMTEISKANNEVNLVTEIRTTIPKTDKKKVVQKTVEV